MAAGTIFAISYQVYTVRGTGGSKLTCNGVISRRLLRRIFYLRSNIIPLNLPECPTPGRCHCVWGKPTLHCGESSMYAHLQSPSVKHHSRALELPYGCEDDSPRCVTGAKHTVILNSWMGITWCRKVFGRKGTIRVWDMIGRWASPTKISSMLRRSCLGNVMNVILIISAPSFSVSSMPLSISFDP